MTGCCEIGQRFGIAIDEKACTIVPASMASFFDVGIYEITGCRSVESQLEAFAEPIPGSTD
jgi:hypothetical protein